MRYHYNKPETYSNNYGQLYICDHPVYDRCTLFKIGNKGLAVIQQRFDPNTKVTYWTEIDPWLCNDIYLNKGFYRLFIKRSWISQDGLYPTIRKLRMRPIPRERWETCFDRKEI